jgi:hypothetical protein
MVERLYKRKEVRELLNISNYEIKKLISKGVLAKPIREAGEHPRWTESQIADYDRKMFSKTNPQQIKAAQGSIVSDKLFKEIRETYQK